MTLELFRKHPANVSHSSNLIQMKIENLHNKGRYRMLNSIGIIWEGIVANNESRPYIKIECTEDSRNMTFLKAIIIDTTTNTDDITTLLTTQSFNYLKITYYAGSATNGSIGVILNYK